MSTLKVEVVPVVVEDIPGADRVGKVRVYGYVCVTAKDQWRPGDLGAFVPPDSLVDLTRPEFSFLDKPRIKGKKIRGVLSSGLLVKAPEGSKEGDDVAEHLGVTKYNPVAPVRAQKSPYWNDTSELSDTPNVSTVKYDLENARRYAHLALTPGETVIATEKIHGANARYVYHDGQMYCGSRTQWKREYPREITPEYLRAQGCPEEKIEGVIAATSRRDRNRNTWWKALTPELRAFCEANPDTVVYGEVYGAVQDLNYGHAPGQVSFIAFDLYKEGKWLDWNEAEVHLQVYGVPCVPVLYYGPFDHEHCTQLAEGKSVIPGANHVREGTVVRPLEPRYHYSCGRVVLKYVGVGYLERSDDNFIGEGD